MKLCQQSKSLVEHAIKKAVNRFNANSGQTIITDIHLQPNVMTGELYIFDDEDNELADATINEWGSLGEDASYNTIESDLRSILMGLQEEGCFNDLKILKPYSFVLVDADKETISDLLLVDDDTLFISDELLQGLDEELDAILKDLLEK